MHLDLQFDKESAKLAGKFIFSCENYELSRQDIAELKKKKLIQYIEENDLPESIPCQVLLITEHIHKAEVMFFNPTFELPAKVFDEPLLNKNLIDRSAKNGWFWIECSLPLRDKGIEINLSYKI